MFLITLSSGFFYTFPLIASVKCFSCLTMIKIVSPIVLLFCYKKSAAVRSQITSKFQKERFARNRGQVQRLSCCRTALHLAKSLLFTDTSMKMDSLSVIGPPEKWRLRTKWSKIYGQITGKCQFVRKMRFDYGQINKNRLFVRKFE